MSRYCTVFKIRNNSIKITGPVWTFLSSSSSSQDTVQVGQDGGAGHGRRSQWKVWILSMTVSLWVISPSHQHSQSLSSGVNRWVTVAPPSSLRENSSKSPGRDEDSRSDASGGSRGTEMAEVKRKRLREVEASSNLEGVSIYCGRRVREPRKSLCK